MITLAYRLSAWLLAVTVYCAVVYSLVILLYPEWGLWVIVFVFLSCIAGIAFGIGIGWTILREVYRKDS